MVIPNPNIKECLFIKLAAIASSYWRRRLKDNSTIRIVRRFCQYEVVRCYWWLVLFQQVSKERIILFNTGIDEVILSSSKDTMSLTP